MPPRTDPLATAFDQPRPLTFVAIDPSLTRTGICVLQVEARWHMDRLQVCFNRKILALLSDKFRERDGGFRALQTELALILSTQEWFVPVVEWPPPKRVGRKASSHEAASRWREWLFALADARWRDANPGLSRVPSVERVLLDPYPQEWRGPIGIACKGIGATEDERARYIKRQSMDYAWRELERWWAGRQALVRLDDHDERLNVTPILPPENMTHRCQTCGWTTGGPFVHDDREGRRCDGPWAPKPIANADSFPQLAVDSDMSEAVCQATWAVRNVGVIGTWLRQGGKPKLLRALI